MKINIQNTRLKITAGLPDQFPFDKHPQIVFAGRSNVGKSSLLNTLIGRKSLARVSSAPGKTITVNFYAVDEKVYFVDLPGYGYAKRSPEEKKRFATLTDAFLQQEHDKRMVIQLIDMKTGPTNDDYDMLDWLDYNKMPYFIVATKSDKLNKSEFNEALTELKKLGCDVVPFSSLKNTGKEEVLEKIFLFVNN